MTCEIEPSHPRIIFSCSVFVQLLFKKKQKKNTSCFFPQLSFFHLRVDNKPAMLLHLLRNVVKPQEQTVVFAATKHHVEYLKEVRWKRQVTDAASPWTRTEASA